MELWIKAFLVLLVIYIITKICQMVYEILKFRILLKIYKYFLYTTVNNKTALLIYKSIKYLFNHLEDVTEYIDVSRLDDNTYIKATIYHMISDFHIEELYTVLSIPDHLSLYIESRTKLLNSVSIRHKKAYIKGIRLEKISNISLYNHFDLKQNEIFESISEDMPKIYDVSETENKYKRDIEYVNSLTKDSFENILDYKIVTDELSSTKIPTVYSIKFENYSINDCKNIDIIYYNHKLNSNDFNYDYLYLFKNKDGIITSFLQNKDIHPDSVNLDLFSDLTVIKSTIDVASVFETNMLIKNLKDNKGEE